MHTIINIGGLEAHERRDTQPYDIGSSFFATCTNYLVKRLHKMEETEPIEVHVCFNSQLTYSHDTLKGISFQHMVDGTGDTERFKSE